MDLHLDLENQPKKTDQKIQMEFKAEVDFLIDPELEVVGLVDLQAIQEMQVQEEEVRGQSQRMQSSLKETLQQQIAFTT